MTTNYQEHVKKYILDKDYQIPLDSFFEAIEKNESFLSGYIFGSEDGKKRFNETLLEIYDEVKNKNLKIPDSFYASMIEHIENNKDSKIFYNDGYKINTASINTVIAIEAIKCGDGLKVIPLIIGGRFSENELLNVSSSVLVDSKMLNPEVIDILKNKIKTLGSNPEEFLLYSYFAEKYRSHKPKTERLEIILKSVNPYIRLGDFEELKKNVPRFGYGYKTEHLCAQLLKLAEYNKTEDFKNDLDKDLKSSNSTKKKIKI